MQYTGFLFYVHTGFCRGEGVGGRRQAVPGVPAGLCGYPDPASSRSFCFVSFLKQKLTSLPCS